MTRRTAQRARVLPAVTISEFSGVRYLHLDSIWVQGAMRIAKPQVVELLYVQRMLAALLWLPDGGLAPESASASSADAAAHPSSHQAVQLGLGAGAITRFTAQQLHMPTTVVEINPQVVQANARWFALPAEAEVVQGDAADWLAQAAPASVRLLHVDLYDEEAAAPVLDGVEFYAACRQVLEPGGVMAVNLFGRDSSFARSLAYIATAFGPDQVWSLQPTREGNTVVVAGRGVSVPAAEVLKARAERLQARFGPLGLKARKWLHMVRPHGPVVAPGQGASA